MKYIDMALKMGAAAAVRFDIADIAFDPRVILKCLFGCGSYGKEHTCPFQRSPLTMDEYREIFQKYKWGIIVGTNDKLLSQNISYEIERACFLDGYYFAFSLSDCGLCETCTHASNEPCRFPEKARPAFHSVGIDVFKTVHTFDLPLTVLTDKGQEARWYSAVFVE